MKYYTFRFFNPLRKLTSVLLVLVLLSAFVSAQEPGDKKTSEVRFQKAFFSAMEDDQKRDLFDSLTIFYLQDYSKTGKEKIQQLQSLVKQKGDPKLNYLLLFARVYLTHTPDSIAETRKLVYRFLTECRRLGDGKRYALGLMMLAGSEGETGNYGEAQKLLLHSLDYARDTLKDLRTVGWVYLSLGLLYNAENDTAKAIEYNKKALEVSFATKNFEDIACVSNNLGMIYKAQGQYDSAKLYYRDAIRIFRQSDPGGMLPNPLRNMSELFRLTHEYDSAVVYARESIRLATDMHYDYSLSGAYGTIAHTFKDMGKADSAGKYYILALKISEKINIKSDLLSFYPEIADYYASTGNYKSAYNYLLKATAIKDSVFNSENNKVLKEMDAKYQAGKKEQEILKQEEQIKRQQIITFGVLALAVVFLVLIFLIYRNSMHRKKANVLLQKEKLRAEQSERAEQQFLANMSHEIRTPMNAVMGMTNLLLGKNPRPDQQQYLDGIQKSSVILLHIINDILDLSKIEAGKIELEKIDFNLNDLVAQVEQMLQHKAEEKGIQLITDIDKNIPILIGDPVRLNQVLMNLAGNAIKFTEKGSVQIVAKTITKNDASTKAIHFSIIDTGIGIPKDKLETVFEKFTQANASDTRKHGGTGLGLSISKQLIELFGGKISIESEEGAGTTFAFDVVFEIGSAERLQQRLDLSGDVDGAILNGLKILIADDNAYNLVVATDTLKLKSDVTVMTALDGRKAIALLKEHDFDVILMDVQMPEMNGFEATQFIRDNFPTPKKNIPIVALTASVLRTDLDKCRQAGMNGYVPKPFTASQLITGIAEVMNIPPRSTQKNKTEHHEITPSPGVSSITDLTYLTKFCNGDEARMRKYIGMFLVNAPLLLDKLQAAMSNDDFIEIANQVHGFKTNWMMMGMDQTKNLAVKIEMQCRQQPVTVEKETLENLFSHVRSAMNELNKMEAIPTT